MSAIMSNNGDARLAASLSTSDTTMQLKPGHGARFAAIPAGSWTPLTIVDSAGNFEIVRATGKSGDTFTIVREQEGTTARAFAVDAVVQNRPTAAVYDLIFSSIADAQTAAENSLQPSGGNISGPLNEKWGASIASASTVDLSTATGNNLRVTGSVTINSFGTAAQNGTKRTILFAGAMTLAHLGPGPVAGAIYLPGGANITTKFDDVATFVKNDNGIWMCASYVRADGTPLANNLIPPGAVASFAMSGAPTGWLKANGAAVSRATYAALFAAIGTTFGAGDGSTTFNLPDLRGEFVRGWDDARGIDTGRAFGSAQDGQNASHTHTGTSNAGGEHSHTVSPTLKQPTSGSSTTGVASLGTTTNNGSTYATSTAAAHTHTFTTAASGGNEARPRNIALLYCIKF